MSFQIVDGGYVRGFKSTTLDAAFAGRDNAFNFMRLCFALLVMVGHAGVIGWGLAAEPFRLPVDTGGVAVTGFFALSGFLISRSGRRTGPLRFVWHRALRIFPGYWVCLGVSAFVLGPLLYWYQHDSLSGFRGADQGPFAYVYRNLLTDQRQYDVGHVTGDAPFANSLNGSLWTLKYELCCYLIVLLLAVTTLLRRARWLTLVAGGVMLAGIVWDTVHDAPQPGPLITVRPVEVPGLGYFLVYYAFVFALAFVLGMAADAYRSVIPINDWLGWASLALTVLTIYLGWPLFGPFIVAYVYLLLWAGVRIPAFLRRVGRRNDYSYGVYIYAFPIQQALAILGAPRLGWTGYLLTSVAATLLVAMGSWHLVEKQALRAKDWKPRRLRKPAPGALEPVETAA